VFVETYIQDQTNPNQLFLRKVLLGLGYLVRDKNEFNIQTRQNVKKMDRPFNLGLSKNWEQVTDNPDHIQLAASAHELSKMRGLYLII
jgi:hypothetical protein